MSILNTMSKDKNLTAELLLKEVGITVVDAARLVLNILDARRNEELLPPLEFCHKVIQSGKKHLHKTEMKFGEGLTVYIKNKSYLRPDSFKDITYLSRRLIKHRKDFSARNFSEFSVLDCEQWISETFSTPSQFNKARAILHGIFEFALRNEWCERNPIKLVARRKVIEKEITPLSIEETKRLIKTSQEPRFKSCVASVSIMALAGVRPREVRRLKWSDIDFAEDVITIRSQCSKTGGVRQVEISPALKNLLQTDDRNSKLSICPSNWQKRWKEIRDEAGFKNLWTQDVLRHTYASYHAKHFADLARLQLNMGHRDLTLLRSRYINMRGITKAGARTFFNSMN